MANKLDRYKGLRLRLSEDQGYERLDSKRLRAPDGSIVLARQESEDAPEDIVLDIGSSVTHIDELPADTVSAPKTRKRKQKPEPQAEPVQQAKELVSIEKGGMVINAYFDMALDTPELVVVRGKRPLAVEPRVSADDPEAYTLTVRGRTYDCLYAGITYCETQDSQTVVFHKTQEA